MNMLTLFIVIAAAAAVYSLASGIYAMSHDAQVGHRSSAEWMTWRVGFQAATIVLILLAMLGPH